MVADAEEGMEGQGPVAGRYCCCCWWYEGVGWWPSWRGAVRERVHAPTASLFSLSSGSSWTPGPPLLHVAGFPAPADPGAVDEMVETSSSHLNCFRFLDRLELRSEEGGKDG